MMKKMMMTMVAVAAMLFVGCGKETTETTETAANEVAVRGTTWVGTQGNPATDASYATYTLNLGGDNSCTLRIDFYAVSEGGHYATTDFTGTYTLNGNNGTMTLTDGLPDKATYNDTFTLNGNSLSLTHGRVTVSLEKQATSGLANNTIVYDGITYQMISDTNHMAVMYFHNELTVFSARSVEQDTSGSSKLEFAHFHIRPEMWNKTQNLATLANEEFYEVIFDGSVLNLVARGSCYEDNDGNQQTYYGGSLDGTEYSDTECLFTSGSYTVRGNNDGSPFTVEMDAVLINGKRLQMKLTSPDYHDQVVRSKK